MTQEDPTEPSRHDRERTLLQITRAVSAHLSRDSLFRTIAARLRSIVPFDRMVITIVEQGDSEMLVYALGAEDRELAPGYRFPIEGTLPGWVYEHGEPRVGASRADLDEFPGSRGLMEEIGAEAHCCIPLRAGGTALGALVFHAGERGQFDALDVDLLLEVGEAIAVAVTNSLAFEEIRELKEELEDRARELERSRREQQQLLEFNNGIIGKLERGSLIEAMARSLEGLLPFDRATLLLHRPEEDSLEVYGLAGRTSDRRPIPPGTLHPRGTVWAWRAIETGQPFWADDLQTRSPTSESERLLISLGLRSLLVVPLMAEDTALGALAIASLKPAIYDEHDGALLMRIAAQMGLAVEKMLAFEEITTLKAQLEREKDYLLEEIRTEHDFEEIVGESPVIRKVFQEVETVAPTDATVLIRGETGTGKELIARAIHDLSGRRERALVKVNCAALPSGLIESELFGHEKGAFTGAVSRKIGRFQLADRGTILLDEVGDLPLELQGKLLRVLEEGEIERVGGTTTIKVDVRVIGATNRDLEEAVARNEYRSDLFYRLNVFPLVLPPLRERGSDVRLLINYFAMKYARSLGKEVSTIPRRAMNRLLAYTWPGNVRELKNVVERAVILSRGDELELGDWFAADRVAAADRPRRLDDVQRRHILDVLEQTGWRVSGAGGAAELLGLKPTTLESRMKKLGIQRPR